MRPLLVVVVDEFRQHRPQLLLVERDQVVGALATEGPDHAFGDRVRTGLMMASTPMRSARSRKSRP
jgi:hypothetical protein